LKAKVGVVFLIRDGEGAYILAQEVGSTGD
jgi:hypothetical protein